MYTAYFIDSTAQNVEEYEGAPYEGDVQSLIDNHGFTLAGDAASQRIEKQIDGEPMEIYSGGIPLPMAQFIPPSIPVKP